MTNDGDANDPTLNASFVMKAMLGQTALFIAVGALMWWYAGRDLAQFATLDGSQLALGLAIAAALTLLGAAGFYGFPKASDAIVKMQAPNYPFLKHRLGPLPIVVISLCAGIGEEALFRGGLQTLLGDYTPVWAAIGISSALFALIHLSRPLICFLQFLIGVVFGVLFWQSGSLAAVMIGHGLYDIFALWYVQKRLHEMNYFTDAERVEGD